MLRRFAPMLLGLLAVLLGTAFPWRQLPPISEDPTRALIGSFDPWDHLDASWSIWRIEFYKVYPALLCVVAVGCFFVVRKRPSSSVLSKLGSLAAMLAACQLFASVALVAQDDLWKSTWALVVSTIGAFVVVVGAVLQPPSGGHGVQCGEVERDARR